MAETKTRSRPKAKSKAKARASSKPKRTRSSNTGNARKRTKASSASKPKGVVDKTKAAGETVEDAAKDAGRSVGRAAGKAKVPLMAGGAALAGVAGGIALGSRQAHRHRGLKGIDSDDLAKAARKVGDIGAQVGEVALEVRRRRAEPNGKVQRSPVEVVLDGLTSRRPR
jgi:hypothetical protein